MPSVSKKDYGCKKCLRCDTIIYHKNSRDIERKKYCSNECRMNKKERIIKNCENCKIEFEVPKSKDRIKCCSKKCTDDLKRKDYSRDTEALKCYRLALEGKTYKEISEITNIKAGTVACYLNKLNYRKYANGGESYQAVKNKLKRREDYQQCCICGFNRIVELAHIVPASKGGPLSYDNTLPLCPNHHHLFDNKKLTDSELSFIKIQLEIRNASKE